MANVDWAAIAHEVIDRINNMTPEEWEATMEKYRYVPSEEDLRYDRVRKLFAYGVAIAIDKGYIEMDQICEALGAPLPSNYYSRPDSEEDIQECERETAIIDSALDEYFQEFFGMRMNEAW